MNKTIVAFIGIVILGLVAAVVFSSRESSQDTGLDINAIDKSTTTVQIPNIQKTTSAPTIVPISATKAVIQTVKGEIDIDLYPQDAPKTVMNFATLAKNKFYDGLTFHRVEPGFVIQGGDPRGDGSGGTSIYGGPFADELDPNTPSYKESYTEGTVAMANSGANTNGSQFFIMWSDKTDLPHNYSIFGKVTTGMETVHKMVAGDKIISITVE